MNRHPLQILADGINQAIQYNAPSDVTARLRGAFEYARVTGTVLHDETHDQRKEPTAPVIETIPAGMIAAEVE